MKLHHASLTGLVLAIASARLSNQRVSIEELCGQLNSHASKYAALSLGFESPPEEFGQSMDVDAILALGQAEALLESGNFWQAIEETNQILAESGLYVSHLFVETK